MRGNDILKICDQPSSISTELLDLAVLCRTHRLVSLPYRRPQARPAGLSQCTWRHWRRTGAAETGAAAAGGGRAAFRAITGRDTPRGPSRAGTVLRGALPAPDQPKLAPARDIEIGMGIVLRRP